MFDNLKYSKWYLPGVRYLLFLFIISYSVSTFGQQYPIYVTASLTPPYSLRLSDYSKVGSQQLMVTIMVNDITIDNLPVKLHIKMESTAGVTVETMPTIATAPIYLSGGQMSLLFGADLADYFNINNLLFKGYSKSDYQRTGQLPEGFYRFTVDVLHYGTNRVISNHGTTMAWIALGKPPQLKTPDEGAELGLITGMPLTFSWLPSNVGIPAAGVHYTFELWELRIPGIAPEVVVASMPPLHTTSQPHTTLVVHPASLFLEPGMRYAWRVTAADPMGQVPFEQDGHSVVRTFTYQSRCDSVTNFTVERQGQRGTFRWTPGGNHTSFNVEMRNPATGYFHRSQAYDNQVTFVTLDFGKTYQMRIQAVCHNDPQRTSDFTDWQTISIPERKVDTTTCPDCRCAESPTLPPITNFTLRKDLQPGDIISNASGATRFILKTVVPQSDGVYKGLLWFWMEIWNVKFLCEYWDLSVNTDNVMIGGDYESVSNPQFLLDADAAKRYVDSLANAIAEAGTNTNIKDTLKLDIPIESIYVNADGNIVVVSTNPDGSITETVLTPNGEWNNTVVQDADGNVYEVDYTDEEVLGGGEYDVSLIDTASTLISAQTTISNKLMEQDSTLTDGTLLGDPIPNPSVTTNNNPYYGYFGCMRYQQNSTCSYDRVPDVIPTKNRPHHGIDVSTMVGENIHALRSGTVVAIDTSFRPQNAEYINLEFDVNGIPTSMISKGRNGCHYSAGYGNKIIIRVDIADTTKAITTITGARVTTYYILYGHLNTVSVNINDIVNAGEIIGTSGCSGNAAAIAISDYHIHIETHTENNFVQGIQRAINPLTLLQTTLSDYDK